MRQRAPPRPGAPVRHATHGTVSQANGCRLQPPGLRALAVVAGAVLLLWPAMYNRYPLVFADTGTYLSQVIERHLGWDRPVFYSLFLLPLHLTLTTWPAIAAQALLAAGMLDMVVRLLLPGVSPLWLVPLLASAAVTTALPWFAAQLMPDLFTPLLVLVLAALACVPERLRPWERRGLVVLAACMIATQHSSVPLALSLLIALPLLRMVLQRQRSRRPDLLRLALAPLLAIVALVLVNLATCGRIAVSPYGNVFLLARVIYDGPGQHALQRACPQADWRLCPWRDRLPATSDDFLWRADSPVMLIGGHRALSAEADAIIAAALRQEPAAEASAFLGNLREQLLKFATGDGLRAWPDTVGRTIARDFPRFEQVTYAASRQSHDRLAVPASMQSLHAATALLGAGVCAVLALSGLVRPHPAASFAATVLLALVLNAGISGGLSAPHDRYQSRVMLLPPLVTVLGGAAMLRDRRAR